MMLEQVAGLHVGTVEMSSPNEIKILVEDSAPQDVAFNAGRPQGFPRINGFVLFPNEGGAVVAVIGRMSMEPLPSNSKTHSMDHIPFPASRRRLFVTPLGVLTPRYDLNEQKNQFRLKRGVTSYPSVGDAVLLPTDEQLRAIVEASREDTRVCIGKSHLALNTPVTIDPDKLFGRHVGVFGNTGSGKSCTVAGLIRWSVEQAASQTGEANAHFVILDPNGEYRGCFADLQKVIDVKVYSVEPKEGEYRLTVPGWFWNSQEWSGALNAAPGTQRPMLIQAMRLLKNASMSQSEDRNGDNSNLNGDSLLLATQLGSLITYMKGSRAEGAGSWVQFPKIKNHHSQIEGLHNQLETYLHDIGDKHARYQLVKDAVETCYNVLKRRKDVTPRGEYPQAFKDVDFKELIVSLTALRDAFPIVPMTNGPTEDTPSAFDLNELPAMIEHVTSLNGGNFQQNMAGLDLRLKTLLADQRLRPIISPTGSEHDLKDWLSDMFGSVCDGRGQISVLDLSLIPSDVLTTIVAVLGRLVFETAQRYRREQKAIFPTVLVLEEAHNFVQRTSNEGDADGSATRCRQTFEKIAKEGRKFGVGLVLSSQRPSELAPTMVAQCNSFILHRIVNDRDQELISKLAPDSTGSLLKELPSLPTQKALLLGIASEIPLIFDVAPLDLNHRPDASNPDFWDVWTGKRKLNLDLGTLASSWST